MATTEKEKIIKDLINSLEDLQIKKLDKAIQLLRNRNIVNNLIKEVDFNAALSEFIYENVIKPLFMYDRSIMFKNNPQLESLAKFLGSDKIGSIKSDISLKSKLR